MVVILTNVLLKLLYSDVCQHLENLCKSVSAHFQKEQSMLLHEFIFLFAVLFLW